MWQSLVTIGPETSEIRRWKKKKETYLSKIYRPAGQLSLPGGLNNMVVYYNDNEYINNCEAIQAEFKYTICSHVPECKKI